MNSEKTKNTEICTKFNSKMTKNIGSIINSDLLIQEISENNCLKKYI